MFFASIRFAPEKREAVIAFLQSIRHLGIAEKGITGEVECSLWTDEEGTEQPAFSHLSSESEIRTVMGKSWPIRRGINIIAWPSA